jgi:hypothetical protein
MNISVKVGPMWLVSTSRLFSLATLAQSGFFETQLPARGD